jgi:ABC-type glycerol-3-phosphate transport system permease component
LRKSTSETMIRIVVHVVLAALGVLYVLPLLWMVSTSLKTVRQIFVYPPQWIPRPVVWRTYADIFWYAPFHRYFLNTLLIEAACITGSLASCSLVAFGFSRFRVPGRNALFILMLSTMMLPYQVWMIPLYILFTKIHWVDTFLPLTIPAFFGAPLYIFLLRQFFLTLPRELEDAAKVDGCSYTRIYRQIVLPLTKPALATVSIFVFMGVWNDFLGPLLYLSDPGKYTLALGLQVFLSQHGAEWSLLMGASTLIVLPVIVVFFFTQKQFIQGIVMTGIKG